MPAVTPVAIRAALSSRTIDLQLDGRVTTVDLTDPDAATSTATDRVVVLVHGFTRSRANMTGHAAALADAGFRSVAPDLPYRFDSRRNARALRDLVASLRAGALGPPAQRIVLIGHSAGGLSALLAASSPGVVGYVGLDPFDRPSRVGLAAARELRIPAYLLRGPPSACNAYAIAEPWVRALAQLVIDRQIADASHCDFESPTNRLCRAICGRTDPARQAEVRRFVVDASRQLLP